MWTKETATEQRPLIRVNCGGLWQQGYLVPDGRNVWVVAYRGNTCFELSVSWSLVLCVLNDNRESPIYLDAKRGAA